MILVERNERDIVHLTRDGEPLATYSSSAMALQHLGKLWAERDELAAKLKEARDVAQVFHDFGEFCHIHRAHELQQVREAESKLLEWQKEEQ